MNKPREILLSSGEKIFTQDIHPDESNTNKKWIAELFVSEFKDAEIIKNINGGNIFEIKIIDKIYNFYFDTTDSGGKPKSRKVEIPSSNKYFIDAILRRDNIYVVNLYRPVKSKKMDVDLNTKIWLVIDPLEIYSCKTVREKTNNGSSRWFSIESMSELLINPSITTKLNRNKNVMAGVNENVAKIIIEYEDKYNLSNSLYKYFKNFSEESDEKSQKENLSKIRQTFRKLLISEGQNNQCKSSIKNEKLLIASHIHSVSDIKNDPNLNYDDKFIQIKDVNNGLLIPVGLDKLFDNYLVTFTDKWEILISNEIEYSDVIEMCGRRIEGKWIKGKKKESLKYLKKHRSKAFQKWNSNFD